MTDPTTRVLLAVIAGSLLVFVVGGAGASPPNPAVTPPGVMAAAGTGTWLWHVLTLGQSAGYSMVLRLYVVLMLLAPFYVALAARRPAKASIRSRRTTTS